MTHDINECGLLRTYTTNPTTQKTRLCLRLVGVLDDMIANVEVLAAVAAMFRRLFSCPLNIGMENRTIFLFFAILCCLDLSLLGSSYPIEDPENQSSTL